MSIGTEGSDSYFSISLGRFISQTKWDWLFYIREDLYGPYREVFPDTDKLQKYLREVVFLNNTNQEGVNDLIDEVQYVDQYNQVLNVFTMNKGISEIERISTREAYLINIEVDNDNNYILKWGLAHYQKCLLHYYYPYASQGIDLDMIEQYTRRWLPFTANELTAMNREMTLTIDNMIRRLEYEIQNKRFLKVPNIGTSDFGRYINDSPYPDDEKYYYWTVDTFEANRLDPNPSWFVFHRISYPERTHNY